MREISRAPAPGEYAANAVRITCVIHHRLAALVRSVLEPHRVRLAITESGRNVRQLVRRRPFGFPGSTTRLESSPADHYSCTVAGEGADALMRDIVAAAELTTPGRGTLFAQRVHHVGPIEIEVAAGTERAKDEVTSLRPAEPTPAPGAERGTAADGFLHDLALITAILSTPGSAEQLGRLALELGTCVPVITGAIGTGMRDRLGLLRVTIPAEKEVVAFLVPSYDAESVIRFLVEEMRIDRPGRGFVYQTMVHAARIDTRLRLGRQEHAASIEQIVAAIDDLKRSTAWRKRFSAVDHDSGAIYAGLLRDRAEITVVCTEGNAAAFTEAALRAGASGATTSRVRSLYHVDDPSISSAAEKSVIHVARESVGAVVEALSEAFECTCDSCGWIQVVDSPVAFAHRPWATRN